ncbi:MAG: TonB family protein [Thermoanaerobaculaceae bacterium]|nr:TonB family protein [Thermoanaerobaculaceae bacterium]
MADTYSSFGKFLLLKQRSQDGLGTLWRAGEMEHDSFRRIVWLRRFDQTGLNRAALSAEIAAANQVSQVLKATNVVRNAVCGSEDGVPFAAWDYVPAQPLDQLMARAASEQFPIAIDNALLIVEKMAAALAAAAAVEVQGESLVHGFLVPHLVMIGNDGEAMVAGFGLARGLRANLDRVALKRTAAPYLAPEVLANGPATRRSDVYSLGAILFQLLCGQPLPADPAGRAAALEHPSLAFEEGPVPADVLAILAKTLSPKADDRFATAADFKRELEKLLYGGAYSPTTFNLALFMDRLYRNEIEQEDREVQRERGLDVAAHYQPPKVEEPEPARAAPSRTGMLAAIIGGAVILLGVIGYLVFSRPASPPALDSDAQKKMLQELVNTQVAQALQEKENQLRQELEAEKAKTEELRKQLATQKQGPAARQISPDEQQRLQRELASREAEQKRKEDELAKVKQQQEAEAAKARQQQAQASARAALPPTAIPTAVAAPTAAPAAVATRVPVAAVPPPTAAPPPPPPTAEVPVTTGLGSGVREGDLVDFTQVDVQPQSLVEAKVTVPRIAMLTRSVVSGYVILRVLVNEKGGVDDVQVLRPFQPARPEIDKACIEAVKQNRYRPAMKDGHQVKTWITVTKQIVIQPAR